MIIDPDLTLLISSITFSVNDRLSGILRFVLAGGGLKFYAAG